MNDYEKLGALIDLTVAKLRALQRQRLLLLLLAAIAYLLPSPLRAAPTTDAITTFTITRVYDGDTFFIDLPRAGCYYDVLCRDLPVRVIGVDAPELRGAGCPEEKQMAILARDFLAAQLRGASAIALIQVKRDSRFRIDARVIIDGQHDLAALLISAGLGAPYSGSGARARHWCKTSAAPSATTTTAPRGV